MIPERYKIRPGNGATDSKKVQGQQKKQGSLIKRTVRINIRVYTASYFALQVLQNIEQGKELLYLGIGSFYNFSDD